MARPVIHIFVLKAGFASERLKYWLASISFLKHGTFSHTACTHTRPAGHRAAICYAASWRAGPARGAAAAAHRCSGKRAASPSPLPGPETAVFGCQAPCAPIQNPHTNPILRRETLRPRNRLGRARTVGVAAAHGGARAEDHDHRTPGLLRRQPPLLRARLPRSGHNRIISLVVLRRVARLVGSGAVHYGVLLLGLRAGSAWGFVL